MTLSTVDPIWWDTGAVDGRPVRAALEAHDIATVFGFLRSRGISRSGMAALTGLSESRVRQIMQGRQQVTSYEVLERIANGLQIPRGYLGLAYTPSSRVVAPSPSAAGFASDSYWSLPTEIPTQAGHDAAEITVPGGRVFPGVAMTLPVLAAAGMDGRVLVDVRTDPAAARSISRSRIALAVASDGFATSRIFGVDTRRVRRHLRGTGAAGARLLVPNAYELDALTLGVLWAVVNLDHALLEDDASLADRQDRLRDLESLPRSSVGRDAADDLNPVTQVWLGSSFCARHVLRHVVDLDGAPAFWTREQSGEEASAWLLFRHKLDYLCQLDERYRQTPGRMSRAFCLPQAAVAASPMPERILLLLAAALMESFGIAVCVTVEPEYASVEGFVLDADRRAVVANWVRAGGLWHVDVIDRCGVLRQYRDAYQHAARRSIAKAAEGRTRLAALADYLDLDWPRLRRRCAALADYGFAGLVEPRSRLLSLDGIERACRYVGGP